MNRKAEPALVKSIEAHPNRRYNPSDFEPFLTEIESTLPPT